MGKSPGEPSKVLDERGVSQESVTPLQLASERIGISQFRKAHSVVSLIAPCFVRALTIDSTTSGGKPDGSSPFKLGNDRQSSSVAKSARDFGERVPSVSFT